MREAIAAAVFLSVSLARPAAGADAAPKGQAYKPTEATLEVYKAKCQACHMADGNSPLPPLNFTDGAWKLGSSVKEIAKVIAEGVPGTAMLPFKGQVPDDQIEPLARYVRSFDKKLGAATKKATRPTSK
ncbi:MAG TPA: c-type cytochrome [Vicinamibacteria bacterium]|nr:c-type cytochrome [Vicinamibacteria bacterium]